MAWIAKLIHLIFAVVARTIVAVFVFNLIIEITRSMSEVARNTADIASSPKTQGLISLVTGGVWTYDGVMHAASDLLIIVSLLSGIVALWGYFSGRKRKKADDDRKEIEHQKKIAAYEEQVITARKQADAAQARLDLISEVMKNGKKNFSQGEAEIANKIISMDDRTRHKTNG